MRDHLWKRGLQQVYQPPVPRKKQEFLSQFTQPELSTTQFLLTQAAYLRPWSWLLSVAIFVVALLITQNLEPWDMWMVSALLPFAALATVTELSRSARYHMEELELSARFSLKSLLMARLTLMGVWNLVLLAVLFPLVAGWSELPLVVTGCFLLCPYCLTSLVCLVISRRFRGSEMVFVCAMAAVAVSGLCFWWQRSPLILLEQGGVAGWVGITLVLLALMFWGYRRYLLCGEELVWN
ncbi:hypothetical protein H9X86_11115 [Pseudoflavonifractor capillosus]|uniref:hypothetical protein n=1 Tax=Pseudoflavonifractor capillosus TaxID=106588 RepID=UPI00195853BD|nr:hypothetical protein [Pseudoflavonifractor capillosus]MBM6897893.1 hypothetical protein [Pseudoflavonifractor capillosus]